MYAFKYFKRSYIRKSIINSSQASKYIYSKYIPSKFTLIRISKLKQIQFVYHIKTFLDQFCIINVIL